MVPLTEMPRYEAYKESGVEWIGELPESWEVRRLKFLFDERNERSTDGLEDLLSVSQYTGVTRKSDKVAENELLTNAKSLEGYKKVFQCDLVSNIMLAWNGSLGFSSFQGIASPAYSVYRLRKNNDTRYFHYLLRSEIYKAEYKRKSSGVIESRLRLYTEDFYDVLGILPPLEVQTVIASFLDKKTAQIDEAIAIKEQQINLLKERKQVTIQKTVTKGLNPNVLMKDSGVDWIGQIPEHWEAIKLKVLFKEVNDRTDTGEETLLSLRMELGLVPHNDVSDKPILDEDLIGYKKVIPKQMVMNRMRAAIGIFGISKVHGLVSPDYAVFNTIQKINLEYFLLLFKMPLLGTQFRLNSRGLGTGSSGFMRLYTESFGDIKVPFCSAAEQDEIVDFIEVETKKINHSIGLIGEQIEKFKEYKTTLINSAVTGKIKVA